MRGVECLPAGLHILTLVLVLVVPLAVMPEGRTSTFECERREDIACGRFATSPESPLGGLLPEFHRVILMPYLAKIRQNVFLLSSLLFPHTLHQRGSSTGQSTRYLSCSSRSGRRATRVFRKESSRFDGLRDGNKPRGMYWANQHKP